MWANWELHRSNYGHNNKNKNKKHNDKKWKKNHEEVHAVKEDDAFEKCVCCILADLLPNTPKNKTPKNNNFNVKEFTKLSLSNKDQDSVSSSDGEGSKWPHNALFKLVFRELNELISKKQKVEHGYSITEDFLVESYRNLLLLTVKMMIAWVLRLTTNHQKLTQ